ncbi:MAG: PAS domain-containing protein [Alphaproteobacteria bacterium]|nr:MAG: PAS domain-containing protein [Alphaproteobacteria bacterium]
MSPRAGRIRGGDKRGSDMADNKNGGKSYLAIGTILVALIAVGLFLIFRFAQSEAERNMVRWQDRLSLVADSRSAEVSAWLNRYLANIEELSADASIQLYASQILGADEAAAAEAQRGYVYSMLSATAERTGFHEQRAIDKVAANVKRPRRAGIALVAADGTPLVMTTGMPVLRPGEWPSDSRGSFIALGPQLDDKTPLVLFGAPIVQDEGMGGGAHGAAWVIGARPLDSDFLQTLEQPGAQSQTAETYIVSRENDGLVKPITPLKGGGRIGEARVDPAASFAAGEPGGFSRLQNYAGTEVLVTGRELTAPVPWVLVRTIKAEEALADINSRRNSMVITLSLATLFVLAALILVWRHGVSRRLEASYREQAALSESNQALSAFLQSVSDAQPTAIAALDGNMTVHFANRKVGAITGIPVAELSNRRLDTAFPAETAGELQIGVKSASAGTARQSTLSLAVDGEIRKYQTEMLPLAAGGGSAASALLVMQDITELVAAREQSETLFKQLVTTLTEIIDSRDPWSRHHSERVADVAATVARELGWQADMTESVRIAGQLVNLGKIFVPTSILTKQTPLTTDELNLVRDSMQRGAELVAGLDFKGPVARILAEMRENCDGSGEPKGLAREDIEPGARVLSVANAFVGMVSARAHRDGLGFDKAIDILQGDAGKRYERRTVAALQNILENKGGRDRWQHYGLRISEEG